MVFLGCASAPPPPVPNCADPNRLRVRPLLYLPSDGALDSEDASLELLDRHLAAAQGFYRSLLVTDTFCVSPAEVHRSTRATAEYQQADSAHLMTSSLLAADGEDRNRSRSVFVAVFVRAASLPCGAGTACLGGGRTFNGYPGSGGGIVQLEHTSLTADAPYPFQSTIAHELGHGFGLVHADCFGEDMASSASIMSYDPSHHSAGLEPSATPGDLLPEERFLLASNALAFPAFQFDAGRTLVGVDGTCELGAMDGSIGPMTRTGYQLLFNGSVVSGPEAQFYTRGQARENCASNIANQPSTTAIRCLFDGALIGARE